MAAHQDRGVETRPYGRKKRRSLPSGDVMVEIVCDSQAGICATRRETAAGHAVDARGGDGTARPVNREPTAQRELRLESPVFGRAEDVKTFPSPSQRKARECAGLGSVPGGTRSQGADPAGRR